MRVIKPGVSLALVGGVFAAVWMLAGSVSSVVIQEAKLDIKPGSCPNSFNRNSNRVLPVALVGTDDFNVLDVDLWTLELSRGDGGGGQATPLEGPPGPHSVVEDAATPFDGELCDCHELEGDGTNDLSLKFDSSDVVAALQLDEFSRGDLVELCVSGTLLDGTPFFTCDCIRIVGRPSS